MKKTSSTVRGSSSSTSKGAGSGTSTSQKAAASSSRLLTNFDPTRSFSDQYGPKHETSDFLRKYLETPTPEAASLFAGVRLGETIRRPLDTDLLDVYLRDPKELFGDAESRPDHYSSAEKELIEKLKAGDPVTKAAKSSLLLTYLRPTDLHAKSKDVVRKATRPKTEEEEEEEKELEDADRRASFETQNYPPSLPMGPKDKVII